MPASVLIVALVALALPATTAEKTSLMSPKHTPVVTFDSPQASEIWLTVNDNVMGGRSKGGPRFDGEKMIFSGSTNTNGGGFSSVRTRERNWQLGGKEGVVARVKGDGRTYIFLAQTNARRFFMPVSYWVTFPTEADTWLDVVLPFDYFEPRVRGQKLDGPPLDAEDVRKLGFMIYDKQDGPFRLEVESVTSY